MEIILLNESGYDEALLGLSLSYNRNPADMARTALRLADKDGGHNKFLESIVIWLDIIAPRYFWQQFDTYRVGVTKQSGSTEHTLTSRPLTQLDFERPIFQPTLDHLNDLIAQRNLDDLKNELPEGFLQERVVCLNYKVLRNIILQRRYHRRKEWRWLSREVLSMVRHPELLPSAQERQPELLPAMQ